MMNSGERETLSEANVHECVGSRGAACSAAACTKLGVFPADCPGWCEEAAPPAVVQVRGHMPQTGDTLPGGFSLARQLGEGGMGRVFASSNAQGHPVAVKVISPRAARTSEGVSRFCAEARALARVDHPNVVRLLDHRETAPWPFFVTDLVQGDDLGALLANVEGVGADVPEALEILEGLFAGVAAIHSAGIVHLDLKPANVLVERERRVRICDFGLARPCAPSCRYPLGQCAGTPGYIAPEVALGEEVAPRRAADVYALGVIGYELLTGERVNASSARASTSSLLTTAATSRASVRSIDGSIREIVGGLLLAAMSIEPRHRPSASTMRAVVRATRRRLRFL